jgi:hypothetical protein
MLGVPVRLHDLTGDDLGIAHVPLPIEVGDLVALEHAEYRVNDVVETGQTLPIAALVRVRQIHLRPLVSRG